MAGAQHKPTRRAVLGAAASLPVLSFAEGPPLGAGSDSPRDGEGEVQSFPVTFWDRALAAFEAAGAEVRRIERETAGASFEAEALREQAWDAAGEAWGEALLRLVASPAPDLEALAHKLMLIEAHEVATLSGGEGCLAALRADALRLAGAGDGYE